MSQTHSGIYNQFLGEWAKKEMMDIELKQSFNKFLLDVQVNANLSITFDSSIVDVFQVLLKKVQFQTYDLESHLNQNREKLFKIADTLFKYEFIGKKQYKTIKNYRLFYLKEMVTQYLQIIAEGQVSRTEKLTIWRQLLPISNLSFWNFIDQHEIEDEVIRQLYNKGIFEDGNHVPEAVINRKRLILNPYTNIMAQELPPQRGNRLPIRRRQIHQESQSEDLMSTYESFQEVKQTNLQLWMDGQKYQRMDSYLEKIDSSSNSVAKLLTRTALQNSLFYNRDFKYLLARLRTFIARLQTIIQQFSTAIAYVDIFGSLRSTLSLVNEYDIDITAVPLTAKKRKEQTDILFKFQKKLQEEEIKPRWLKHSFVNYRENIPVPFIKITLDDLQIKREFQLKNVAKIDVTVGNKTALINSELFSCFAQKQQILLFCLAVKLWAKSNNIINGRTPMDGLSSYGVILMCIFFLMKTEQLDFLDPSLCISPERISKPQVLRCEMLDIDTNFCQFLKFYGEEGPFHEQRMIASLLEDPPRDKFDEAVIINMYDFIDERNPGRLSITKREFFYSQFRTARITMQTRDPITISDLFGRSQ